VSVSVVDYGLGNLGSVVNMFKRIGTDVQVVSTADDVSKSERVLLPGVGAFDHGMERLANAGLDVALREFATTGRPFLGICLGMQLLLDASEEGERPGLGIIPGESRRFDEVPGLRIPHMGWNPVAVQREDSLTAELEGNNRFYFVHSYRVLPARAEDSLGITSYGQDFSSMIRADNVMGAQFHPEKSHFFGMTILRNFAAL
jgi:glutamine amidotransferase